MAATTKALLQSMDPNEAGDARVWCRDFGKVCWRGGGAVSRGYIEGGCGTVAV
uniref:Uncharacterized protein n=1 Tax=Arundo donax TaxID=35708 RepID=A0A0A9AHN1_ARUDO